MSKIVSIGGSRPLGEDEALAQVRGRRRRDLSPTALAKAWCWSRTTVRRRLNAWEAAGYLVVDDRSVAAAGPTGWPITRAAARSATVEPAAGHAQKSWSWINTAAFLAAVAIACVSSSLSIFGLTAIFAAAFWPVAIMGATLEVGRLVTAAWLSRYWHSTPRILKWALTAMVLVLMGITSMGVFGFLSKAHIDRQVEVDVHLADEAAVIDGQISIQAAVVADFDRRLSQIDLAIEEAARRGRSISAMSLASQERKGRTELAAGRQKEAQGLAELRVRRAGVDGEGKRLAAEVGPVRYLAQLLGGPEADLEGAVRLLTLTISALFDPLAVLLLIAATR
jgi:uncharacterized membrane protein YecN with MAPEG domain